MGTLYLVEPYCFIKKESERLKIFKEGQLLREVRANDYARVYVHDSSTLTTGALQMLAEKNIDVVYFQGSEVIGRFVGTENRNVSLRIAQVKAHLEEEKSLQFAKNMVMAKILNTRTSLQRYQRSRPSDEIQKVIDYIKIIAKKVDTVTDLNQLRGIEGSVASEYFRVFPLLIKGGTGFIFAGRSKRPAKDEVNTLLNYGYALLRAEISGALTAAGLDPYIGFLHRERYGRESLALDMMEEFRSIFIDNLVIRLINQPMISKKDFICEQGAYRLSKHARTTFLQEFDRRRKSEVTHRFIGKKMAYRQIFHTQALLLAKAIKGEMEDYYPFLVK